MKECEDKEFQQTDPNKLQEVPPEVCCDTRTVKQIPDELREPVGTPFTAEQEFIPPGPIRIYNARVVVKCELEGTTGVEVEIPEGKFVTKFFFSSVLSITENVLSYIESHHLESEVERRVHIKELTPESLRRLTGMTLKQGKEFLDQAYSIQSQQDRYAKSAAESQLDCYYFNTPQTAYCSDDEMAHTGEHAEAVFEATIQGGKYSSNISQEVADEAALAAARALLDCFYINDVVEVDCFTWPNRPQDYDEVVPNDEAPIYPGKDLRVGKVSVGKGQFKSYSDKEAANERALSYGYSLLNCWFPNNPVYRECEDPQARNLGVNPDEYPRAEANPDTGELGQYVTIPEGYIKSELSRTKATEEAEILAESLLECCFINDPFVLKCESQEIRTLNGTPQTIYPSTDRGVAEIHIKAGEYTSCLSKEDANKIARQMTEGLLECYYCNPEIEAQCVPSWVREGVASGAITLPLGDIITDGVHAIAASALPPEATIGAKAGAFCVLNNAQMAVEIAEAAGGVHAQNQNLGASATTCIYTNDAVYAECAAGDPFSGTSGLSVGEVNYRTHPTTGEAYIFYTMYSPGTCFAEEFSRASIAVPAGMFSAVGDNMKDECNRKALDLALSQLFCVFSSPDVEGVCEGVADTQSLCASKWTVNKGVGGFRAQLASWSNSVENPVRLPAGYFLYVGTGGDNPASFLADAANTVMQSLIMCIYTNKYVAVSCHAKQLQLQQPPEGCKQYINEGTTGHVAAETIFSESPYEADRNAYELAYAMATCDVNTVCTFEKDIELPYGPWIPGWSSSSSSSPQDDNDNSGYWDLTNCCYNMCPYYTGGATIAAPADGTRVVSLLKSQQRMQATSLDRLNFLSTKADGLLNYVNALISQYE